jgi:hypothetical protein
MQSLWKRNKEPELFEGEGERFKELIQGVSIFGEYGCGYSTVWVYENTQCKILSVDSSREWVDKTLTAVNHDPRVDCRWVDLGELRRWGRPKSYERRENFPAYINSIWERGEQPQMILVDGRFRVSCFLKSLLQAEAGCIIVFDDYVDRSHYHIVEEFVPIKEICGRQAYFEVPQSLDREAINEISHKFLYVMD